MRSGAGEAPMAYVSYNRPLSKVGFRLFGATRPAEAAAMGGVGSLGDPAAWTHPYTGLGALGDDAATLASIGFTAAQISQIMAAHQSGALSDGGYQALVSGYIAPNDLAAFLESDVGYTGPTSTFSWFTESTLIPGIPNVATLAIALGGVSVLAALVSRR